MKKLMRKNRQHSSSTLPRLFHAGTLKQMLAMLLIIGISVTSLPETAYAALGADNDPVTVSEETNTQDTVSLEGPAEQPDAEAEQETSGEQQEEPYIISELIEKRDEKTKYFAMSDGTTKACIYPQNVHYLKNGQYEEIDNTLAARSDGGKSYYTNQKNSFSVKIPETLDDDYIEFSDDHGFVKFRLAGAAGRKMEKPGRADMALSSADGDQTAVRNVNDRAAFKSVKGSTDIEYDLSGNKLKETIVLYENTKNSFTFDVQTSAASAVKNNDNSISFYDADGTELYRIDSPYMTDEAGAYSNAVGTVLTAKAEGYTLTYTPDQEWLSAEERVYPVRIDPTLVQAIYSSTVTDTYVSSAQNANTPDIRGGWDVLNIGRRTSTVDGAQIRKRGFIRFEIPGEIGKNACIVDARLDLVHYTVSSAVSVNGIQIDVHELTSGFTEGGTWWGNQPSYDPVVTDYAIVNTNNRFSGSTLSYDSYNITRLVSRWHNGSSNYGLLLKLHDEGTAVSSSRQVYYFARQSVYYGSVSKFVEITYRNTVGLEDYWSYTEQEVDESGSTYVNNFNGSLTYVHADASLQSGTSGITLAHVYNSAGAEDPNEYAKTAVKYGNGWSLNLIQTLKPASVSGNSRVKYVYTDGDGTGHYLVQLDDGRIVDEDGLGYTYSSAAGDTYPDKITAKDKTVMSFDNAGYLREIKDSNGNSICMEYTAISANAAYLTSVVSSTGGSITLKYDSGCHLTSVADSAGRETSFLYNEDHFLKHIYYPDGRAKHFAYDEGASNALWILHRTHDMHNIYTYDANSRVASVHMRGGYDATAGITQDFSYGHNQTTVTDHKGRSITYQFDTFGRPVCVYDSEGNAVSQSYTSGSAASSEIFKNNKVSLSSNHVRYTDNLVKDGSFSRGREEWINYTDGSNAGAEVVTGVSFLTEKSIKLSVDDYG